MRLINVWSLPYEFFRSISSLAVWFHPHGQGRRGRFRHWRYPLHLRSAEKKGQHVAVGLVFHLRMICCMGYYVTRFVAAGTYFFSRTCIRLLNGSTDMRSELRDYHPTAPMELIATCVAWPTIGFCLHWIRPPWDRVPSLQDAAQSNAAYSSKTLGAKFVADALGSCPFCRRNSVVVGHVPLYLVPGSR